VHVPIDSSSSQVYFESSPHYVQQCYNESFPEPELIDSTFLQNDDLPNISSSTVYSSSSEISENDTRNEFEESNDYDENSQDSDFDSEMRDLFNDQRKVNANSNTTISEALLMVLAYFLRHNLTWQALEHLLLLINSILGSSVLPKSKYLFKKVFPPKLKPSINFFCKKCNLILDHDQLKNLKNETCPTAGCGEHINLSTSKGSNFFLTFPIKSQVKELIEKNCNFAFNGLNSESNTITDVCDSILHKNLPTSTLRTVTLTVNTDGCSVFESKKKGSLWPLQLIVNELDPKIRFLPENIIVTGIWFGGDPPMEIFLKPFIMELRKSNQTEISIGSEKFKIMIQPLIFTVDTIAKDCIQKKIQFNGYNGCSYCDHPGINLCRDPTRDMVELGKKSNQALKSINQIRYPTIENTNKRTHEGTIADMRQARITNETVRGFKNLSPLVGIKNFDVINGMAVDYMHNCLLGVMTLLLELWFNSNFHQQPFYIGMFIGNVNNRLLNIKPPNEMSRAPRSVLDRCYWKANDMRNFLLFYGIPCLFNILKTEYFDHFGLFSSAVFILLQTEISSNDLCKAQGMLDIFVRQFETFYGPINVTYNVHLLTHLSDCVSHCGPLWAHSTFHFEDNNAVLTGYVNGTRDVLKQVALKYSLHKLTIDQSYLKSEIMINFNSKLNTKKRVKKFVKNETTCFLGSPKNRNFNEEEIEALRKTNLLLNKANCYNRMIHNKTVFSTSQYCEKKQIENSYITLKNGAVGQIKYIFINQEYFYILYVSDYIVDESNDLTKKCTQIKCCSRIKSILTVSSVNEIRDKCIVTVNNPDKLIFSTFANKFERD
jgi:hypothetical protein